MVELKKLLVEQIDRARASGRAVTIDFPATRDAIADLESRCGSVSGDIRDLVSYAAGFSFEEFAVRFIGDYPFEFQGMFACSIPIATDGAGNFWVVDVGPDGSWRSVFFVAHDPPVALLQARDIGIFVQQTFELPRRALLSSEVVARIWKDNPYTMPRAQAMRSSDPVIRTFAQQLDDGFIIADLRAGQQGTGFVWGSAGPNTEVRRAGEHLLFATEQKKRGAFARLFSR
jgi:hypothetical protein